MCNVFNNINYLILLNTLHITRCPTSSSSQHQNSPAVMYGTGTALRLLAGFSGQIGRAGIFELGHQGGALLQ